MNIHIFTEDSNTTADDMELPVIEYYKGLFATIAGLYDELEEFGDTHLHILSKEYGVIEGHENLSNIREERDATVGTDKMLDVARDGLLDAADDADVLVILLSSDIFQATVIQQWKELTDEAKPNSVWCLGVARSMINEIESSELEAKGCTLLTYRRTGVARIGTETRKELLATVEQKSTK